MNILKWVLVIVVAYTLGYFSHFPDAESFNTQAPFVPDGCPPPLSAVDDLDKSLLEDKERMQRLGEKPAIDAKPTTVVGHDKSTKQGKQDGLPPTQFEKPTATPGNDVNQGQSSSVEASNITNEEIDKLVPAPFNEHVKRSSGKIREKLKEFSEATEQDDWDITTQNKITDYLLGNSYSKFVELHSVSCKANFCEIRGRELKPNVFGVLFPEMMMQDWWDMADSQWSNGGANGEVYALFLRRPSIPQ
jgi:hypothetical protein